MIRRPPRATRTDTLVPYTTRVRSFEAVAEELVAEVATADEDGRIERADVVFLGPAHRAVEAARLAPGGRRRLAAALLIVQAVVRPVDLVHREAEGFLLRPDRKSVVQGKSVYVRVDLGGRRIIKNKKQQ